MNKPNKKHHLWVMWEPRRIDQIAEWIPSTGIQQQSTGVRY